MQHFDADSMASRLDYDVLIPALRSGMATEAVVPPRQHYALDEGPGADQEAAKDATLLVMPAWNREFLGVKLVDVFPANTAHGRATPPAPPQQRPSRTRAPAPDPPRPPSTASPSPPSPPPPVPPAWGPPRAPWATAAAARPS